MVTLFVKLNFISGSIMEKLRRVDWLGVLLFTASVTSVMIPISWGGVSYSWDSWHTLVPLIVGIFGMVGFTLHERFIAAEPMMPLAIFANWTLRVTYFQTIIHGMILWSLLYYLPLYYEAIKGYSPIITGVAIFPETFTVAPASVIVGIVVSITGRYRWALWSGWLLTILGTGLLYLMDVDTTVVQWIFLNLVVGLGTGVLFPAMAFSIQSAVEVKHIAFGTAFFSFFRAFGQALGIAVGGSIFQNQIKSKIMAYPLLAPMAEQYGNDATSLVSIIQGMQPGDARDQLMQAYADSLKTVWIVMCALAATGGVTSIFVKAYSLDQVLVTEQGFNHKKEVDTEAAVKVEA